MINKNLTKVALIGVGMVSKVYADALKNLSNEIFLTGVMGSNKHSGEKFLSQYKFESFKDTIVFSSVDEIANDKSIDFVILTTPPNKRIKIVKKLIDGQKPILMEKPIERTLKASNEIEKLSIEKNIKIAIMLQHRARPSAIALKKKIKKEDFGPLQAVEIYVPWWRDQSYYDQPGRGTYSRDGGGVLISQAIHTLDLAMQFTGEIEAVTSMNKKTSFHSMESEDFVSAGLEFKNNCLGTLFASTATYPGRSEEIILHYKDVTAILQSNLLQLKWHNGENETIGKTVASGAGADPMSFTSDWHKDMILNFKNCLLNEKKPVASISSALEVHKLISLLEISGKKQSRVEIGELD